MKGPLHGAAAANSSAASGVAGEASPTASGAAADPAAVVVGDKVPFWQKVAYGAGGPVEHFTGAIPKSLYTPVFNIGLGMNPAVISVVLMVMTIWDAMIDPFIGNVSDNTRTRWGRRRPYIVVGAVLTAILMPVLWLVPEGLGQVGLASWFIGIGLLLYTCSSIWAMPYYSLNLEMTPDYDERTRVVAYRATFQHVFYLFGSWILYLASLPVFADPVTGKPDLANGMRTIGFVMGGIILVLGVIPGLFVKERYYRKTVDSRPKVPLIRGLKQTLRTKPFLLLIGVVLLKSFGAGLVATLGFYLNAYYVCEGDLTLAAKIQGIKATAYFVPGLLAIPFFTWLSARIGKIRLVNLTLLGGILSQLAVLVCYNPKYPYLQILPGFLGVPLGAALWMLMPSMQADVIDYDELQTGQRREGSFASVFSWIYKLSTTITVGAAGFVLVWTGFEVKNGASQPPHVLDNMLLFYVFVPVVFLVAAFFLLRLYPLTRERSQEIRDQLEARRGKM